MINAFLRYTDGRTLEREIRNVDRFKKKHLDDLTSTAMVGHDFAYRIGQDKYLVSVYCDESIAWEPWQRWLAEIRRDAVLTATASKIFS